MNTRDLGTHAVELHDQGTLDIIGGGVRVTLPAHETFELLQWLYEHKDILQQAMIQEQLAEERAVEKLTATPTNTSDQDIPIDEP